MGTGSVDEILDFAIEKEQEAAAFYTDLAGKVAQPGMKEVFQEFALEEKGHREKLIRIKGEGRLPAVMSLTVPDLKIADYLVEVEPKANMGYQEALILAMKAEKAAFKLYHDLASATDDADLKATFLALAQEEAKHKLRFEIEYDDNFLREN